MTSRAENSDPGIGRGPFRIGRRGILLGAAALAFPYRSAAAPFVPQPYFAALFRVVDAFAALGEPLPATVVARLRDLAVAGDVTGAEALLAPLTLARVTLGANGYGVPGAGLLSPELVEEGWRSFLVRVDNPTGSTGRFSMSLDGPVLGDMESASSQHFAHERQSMPTNASAIDAVRRAGLAIGTYDAPPLDPRLLGIPVEYRIAQLIAFRSGRIDTGVTAGAFPNPQYVWAPAQKGKLHFLARPSRDIAFPIRDADDRSVVAALVIRDEHGRLFPDKRGRLAPDMFFQDQVYRSDGETVRLPDGRYTLTARRGPEYHLRKLSFAVGGGATVPPIRLERWVDPAAHGYYSGDVHVHAAGCAHYNDPSVGVGPETMARHAAGEDLRIAEILTWGPGWEVQGKNFTGRVADIPTMLDDPQLQAARGTGLVPKLPASAATIRYDVEVSGFPSSQSGHLLLLGLKEQNYPATKGPRDWPSWSLPILRWAKAQGAVTGFAHFGLGLADLDGPIPSLSVPSFDSIGANEYLIDVAHDAVDFLAGGDTIPAAEMTLWYHALNCGFRTVLAGETDWPCMSDKAMGGGRTYAHLDAAPQGDTGYADWLASVKAGRCYMGDGRAHLFDWTVDGVAMGGEVHLAGRKRVRVVGTVVAWLDPAAPPDLADIRERASWLEPRWHLERARIAGTRTVPIEIVVNGRVVATRTVPADGSPQRIEMDIPVSQSSWVAMRILPSLHANPVFVLAGGDPVRAARTSADWCLASIDKLAATQLPQIEVPEREEARAAYTDARSRFAAIRRECRS